MAAERTAMDAVETSETTVWAPVPWRTTTFYAPKRADRAPGDAADSGQLSAVNARGRLCHLESPGSGLPNSQSGRAGLPGTRQG